MIIRHYLKNIVIVSMFFSISCSEPEKAKRLDSDLSVDESHQNDSTSIQLNNGEKWKVDEGDGEAKMKTDDSKTKVEKDGDSKTKTGDGIQQNHYIMSTFNKAFCFLQGYGRNFYVLLSGFIKG